MLNGIQTLLAQAGLEGEQKLPPVHLWNPPFCGDIDIRIARDGSWYHEGTRIGRDSLVRLLSSLLKREGEEYFLVTPVEKVRIRVDDVPFIAVSMTEENPGTSAQAFVLCTLTGDIVRLDHEHPLRVQTDPVTAEPRPYIMIRGGMEARIHRPVFYQLVDAGHEALVGGVPHLVVTSAGETFSLGRL